MQEATPVGAAAAPAALAHHKGWLVERGDEMGKLGRENDDWQSQARVLLEAARTETEPAVLINLLRYQRARNDNWIQPKDLFTPLEAAMRECVARAAGDSAAALELIRHLLVYTLRAYTFEAKLYHEESKRSQKSRGDDPRQDESRTQAGGGRQGDKRRQADRRDPGSAP